jgi:hypothetical protein
LQLICELRGVYPISVDLNAEQFSATCQYRTGAAEIGRQTHQNHIVVIDHHPTGQIHSLGRAVGEKNVVRGTFNPVTLGGQVSEFLA